MQKNYPKAYPKIKEIYELINSREQKFFAQEKKRWLVHGDAHPENVIRMSPRKLAVIDFTDLCLADFARDLGSFSQQLEYMIGRKIKDRAFATRMKNNFLSAYFSYSSESLTTSVEQRIQNYYHWTAMRTATHFLMKATPEPQRAFPIIENVYKKINKC